MDTIATSWVGKGTQTKNTKTARASVCVFVCVLAFICLCAFACAFYCCHAISLCMLRRGFVLVCLCLCACCCCSCLPCLRILCWCVFGFRQTRLSVHMTCPMGPRRGDNWHWAAPIGRRSSGKESLRATQSVRLCDKRRGAPIGRRSSAKESLRTLSQSVSATCVGHCSASAQSCAPPTKSRVLWLKPH